MRLTRIIVRLCSVLAATFTLSLVLSAAQTALAVSPNVVISQVYGGGGNSGATFTNDYIELFNRGTTPISLNGFSVQYASATGTTWQVTPLTNFTLQPGQYYLVQEASTAAVGSALPTPDATGIINLSATNGKVALVNNTTALSGACPTGANIIDFIGYGTANCFEGTAAAAAGTNTTADIRNGGGRIDTDQNSTDFTALTPTPRNSTSARLPVGLTISEFRLRGPNGANDEFVEIYNNGNADLTVSTTDGSAGFALVASDGIARFMIPNNTVIPARGHYLGVNSGYSLATYPAGNGTTATSDATPYTSDIPDNAGIALFSTATPANFTLANRLDAVGSMSETNALYKEDPGYPAISMLNIDSSFYRNNASGTPKDTNDNAADFLFVDTLATNAGSGSRLGAPGPENLASPVQRNATIKATLIDPGCTGDATAATQACPRFRDPTSDSANNSNFGTLSIRRRFVNNTGQPVTRLRFRVVDITTLQRPNNTTADLRVRTSADQPATCQGTGLGCPTVGAAITINGTTLETPPTQSVGGGFNSSLSAGTITLATTLGAGNSINLQFLLGVQQTGSYRFFVNVEALPGGASFTAPTSNVKGTRSGKQ